MGPRDIEESYSFDNSPAALVAGYVREFQGQGNLGGGPFSPIP